MEKKKVVHIVTAMSWRGGEQQVAYLLQELNEKLNQTVICMKGSAMEKFCLKQGFNCLSYPKRVKLDPSFAYFIKKVCNTMKIDLCHLHDAHAHTMAILSTVLFRNKTPLVLSRRVDFPIKKSFFSRFKYNHQIIKKIICVSKAIQEIIKPEIRNYSKLQTIYSGIDLKKFKNRSKKLRNELNLSDSEFLIGNTSALADHKDYYTYVDVAEKVLQLDCSCSFVIIGDGPMKEEIEQYVWDKGLNEKIYFTGFRTDLPEILADLDIFLITSKTEGLGTSILDAFACGLPVVGTTAGGIPELITNEINGIICPVADVNCLTSAIKKLIGDRDFCSRLAGNAYERVQQFAKEKTAEKTFEVYREVFS